MSQPQYSPDGRFYWDGARWVPVPDSTPTKKPLFDNLPRAACGCLVVLGVLFLGVILIGVLARGGS